jgi:CRISPR system Cascade subunit CasE
MSELFLSRARLRRDVPAAALWSALAPTDEDRRMQTSHRLVWTLFADDPTRTRDFLWREVGPGHFYFLSRRPPEDRHRLFDLDPPKRFSPELCPGDVLRFTLRANATVARRPAGAVGRARGKPCDVVMDALFRLPTGVARAAERQKVIHAEGRRWLCARGAAHGFRLVDSEIDADGAGSCVTGYRVARLDDRKGAMRIGVLDFDGTLVVEDPARFLDAVGQGFGRAKAFGCGLMMIRRA